MELKSFKKKIFLKEEVIYLLKEVVILLLALLVILVYLGLKFLNPFKRNSKNCKTDNLVNNSTKGFMLDIQINNMTCDEDIPRYTAVYQEEKNSSVVGEMTPLESISMNENRPVSLSSNVSAAHCDKHLIFNSSEQNLIPSIVCKEIKIDVTDLDYFKSMLKIHGIIKDTYVGKLEKDERTFKDLTAMFENENKVSFHDVINTGSINPNDTTYSLKETSKVSSVKQMNIKMEEISTSKKKKKQKKKKQKKQNMNDKNLAKNISEIKDNGKLQFPRSKLCPVESLTTSNVSSVDDKNPFSYEQSTEDPLPCTSSSSSFKTSEFNGNKNQISYQQKKPDPLSHTSSSSSFKTSEFNGNKNKIPYQQKRTDPLSHTSSSTSFKNSEFNGNKNKISYQQKRTDPLSHTSSSSSLKTKSFETSEFNKKSKKVSKKNLDEQHNISYKCDIEPSTTKSYAQVVIQDENCSSDSFENKIYGKSKILEITETSFILDGHPEIKRTNCYLFGVKLSDVSLLNIFKLDQIVEFEFQKIRNVEEYWIGKATQFRKQKYELLIAYCRQNKIDFSTKCALLQLTDYIPDDCAPMPRKLDDSIIVSI